jgi:nucleotide-binding universal stress UspA family protein
MYDTILVPLDGSTLAERVLPYAERLARAAQGRIRLFQAVPEVSFVPRAERDIDYLAERLRQHGLTVQSSVRHGDAAHLILDEARAQQADLIMMSTHGGSGHGRWLYGNIADSVLRRASVPVLLVPSTSDHPWPADRALHVLVALDGSEPSREALSPARELSKLLGGRLHLVEAIESPVPYSLWQSYPDIEAELFTQQAKARQYLEDVANELRAEGQTVETDAVIGPPASAVASLARERDVDLIVMATYGQGHAIRVTLGSTATGTLQRSHVPLLFVHPRAEPAAEMAPADLSKDATSTALEREGSLVTLTLNAHELDLLERGLDRLLGEIHPAESVYQLATRLRQAQAAASHPRGGAAL